MRQPDKLTTEAVTAAPTEPSEVLVPYQDRPLERPTADRIRRLRRHLVEALRDLRRAKRPDRLIQPRLPAPDQAVAAVLTAGCAACRGYCCLGGGEHAWLDERTMARVRRERPALEPRAIVRAYVEQVAPLSYAGSCLFHGAEGCTLEPALRAELCISYYCDSLKEFLRRTPASQATRRPVVIRAVAPQRPTDDVA